MSSPFTFAARSSGVLLHPTSLPSRHGSGDLGREAHRFADFLAAAGQRWWQMLPVGPPGNAPGFSPYSSNSALAGSPFLISLDRLVEDGFLSRKDVEPTKGLSGKSVSFPATIAYRLPRLRKAFDHFLARTPQDGGFQEFCREQAHWLDDFALYSALKARFKDKPWDQWPHEFRLRVASALEKAREELAVEILFHQFLQYRFDRQWRDLREHCHTRDVGLIGDIPIFVAYDSADVWAHRHLFLLDRAGAPTVITGCPPDLFNAAGQLWNHPHYRWENHEAEKFAWWTARFKGMTRLFDGVRIDHFLGFHRAWAINAKTKNAKKGKWLPTPGEKLFKAVMRQIGSFPIIAEDLGFVTPEAVKLRDQLRFPGMRVFQVGFGSGAQNHLPHHYIRQCVAYTGTHDNQTARGWLDSQPRNSEERTKALDYLSATPSDFHQKMIHSLHASVADTVIFPLQDLLGLNDSARMNVPGEELGNWSWRLHDDKSLTPALAKNLRRQTEIHDRI